MWIAGVLVTRTSEECGIVSIEKGYAPRILAVIEGNGRSGVRGPLCSEKERGTQQHAGEEE